ncbi:hypothetical protein JTE90_011260 [Oedothorax gibbosus]|uniref:Uncharacterized protein n=1 Tax=Oedothorax gibbosus TaxID=931172 RepID=A0AAV6W2F5_9ARAC|nr:hypothetical protein JTE90_011260 [Oedothorax gibbosus]
MAASKTYSSLHTQLQMGQGHSDHTRRSYDFLRVSSGRASPSHLITGHQCLMYADTPPISRLIEKTPLKRKWSQEIKRPTFTITYTGNMRVLYAILLISLFAGVLVNEAYGEECESPWKLIPSQA